MDFATNTIQKNPAIRPSLPVGQPIGEGTGGASVAVTSEYINGCCKNISANRDRANLGYTTRQLSPRETGTQPSTADIPVQFATIRTSSLDVTQAPEATGAAIELVGSPLGAIALLYPQLASNAQEVVRETALVREG
mgnify:CR=1 FL=1